jgi:ATP-binding cassette, subfamily B, bacterial
VSRAPALPTLVAASVRLAFRAGRKELVVMLAMQALSIVGVVVGVLLARSLLNGLLDAERAGRDIGALVPTLLGIAAVTAGLGVASAIQVHRQRLLAELCARYGEERVLAVTGSVELSSFDDPEFHDHVERALLAVRRLPAVINTLSGLLRAAAGALGAVLALVAIQPLLAPVVLLVLAPLGLAARRRGRAFYRFATDITPQDRERNYLAATLASREAAQEVRAYGLFGFLAERQSRLWDERLARLRSVADRQLVYTALADVAAGLIVSATLLVLVAAALSHDIGLAGAGAAAAALVLLAQRLTLAGTSAAGLSESALYMGDYLSLVATPLPSARAGGGRVEKPMSIRAEHVTFAYPGANRPALCDVSLEVAPGEVVALVGENGSGKTTLAKLLAGLYLPQGGRVMWNGVATADSDRDELRRHVAVIFQDFMQYSLPARENIGLGRPEALPDDAGIERASRIAGAHETLDKLPSRYDTVLGPEFAGGTDLSIGQWQRVALARAVFRDAPFVILDEPTAALDARAEHDLFARIRELLAGRSVLLISHRFSSVREADRIHVMNDGAIVETGTHDELIAHGGRYAELFELQAAPYR